MDTQPSEEEDFWGEVVRRTGINSAMEGFDLLKSYIESGTASDKALHGLFYALRSMSQKCQDQMSARREAKKRTITP